MPKPAGNGWHGAEKREKHKDGHLSCFTFFSLPIERLVDPQGSGKRVAFFVYPQKNKFFMFGLVTLLFFVSFVALIWGLIKPSGFNRLFRGATTRKKTTWTFLGALAFFLIILGVTAPKTPITKSQPVTASTNNPAVQPPPANSANSVPN